MLRKTSSLYEHAFTWYTQNSPCLGPASVIAPKTCPLSTSHITQPPGVVHHDALFWPTFLFFPLPEIAPLSTADITRLSSSVTSLKRLPRRTDHSLLCVPQDTRPWQASFEGLLSLYYIYFCLISISESDLILNSKYNSLMLLSETGTDICTSQVFYH